MTDNPPKVSAIVSFAVAAFFAVMIFLPGMVGIDGFDGGFALSFISIIISIVAAIVGAMYWGWATRLDKLLHGENLLVHWVYSPEVWAYFTEKEYKEDVLEKRGLFILVTAFALFFGFLFWALDAEAGLFVFLVMLGLIGLVAFVWRFSAWNNYRQNSSVGVKEAYISREGVFMNRKFTCWRAPFTSLDGVTIENQDGLMLLLFQYTMRGRYGPQSYTTRVPVPPDQEEVAKDVARSFNMQK